MGELSAAYRAIAASSVATRSRVACCLPRHWVDHGPLCVEFFLMNRPIQQRRRW